MTLVAAEPVSGSDGIDQPIGEMARLSFARLERLRDGLEHLRPDEHVALRDVVGSGAMSFPVLRAGAGMLRGAAFDIDHADLSLRCPRVRGEKTLERVGGRFALG